MKKDYPPYIINFLSTSAADFISETYLRNDSSSGFNVKHDISATVERDWGRRS